MKRLTSLLVNLLIVVVTIWLIVEFDLYDNLVVSWSFRGLKCVLLISFLANYWNAIRPKTKIAH